MGFATRNRLGCHRRVADEFIQPAPPLEIATIKVARVSDLETDARSCVGVGVFHGSGHGAKQQPQTEGKDNDFDE